MKSKFSTLLISSLLTSGIAVSMIAAPAFAKGSNGNGNSSSGSGSSGGKTTTASTSTGTGSTSTVSSSPSFSLLEETKKIFNFANIFTNPVTQTTDNSYGDSIVGQFSLEVIKTNTSKIFFNILNAGPGLSFISQINFSDPFGLLSNGLTNQKNTGTVNFLADTQNLAQSNNIAGWNNSFGFTANKPGSDKDGIDMNESLGILFDGNFDNVISKLTSGDLKLGMHVQGLAGGYSDSFVTKVPVPTPVTPAPEVPQTPETVVDNTPVNPTPEVPQTPETVVDNTPVNPTPEVPQTPISVPGNTTASDIQDVPEPATLVGLGLVASGMFASRRRKTH